MSYCPVRLQALDLRVSGICYWLSRNKVSARRALVSSLRTELVRSVFFKIAKENRCRKRKHCSEPPNASWNSGGSEASKAYGTIEHSMMI